MSRVARITVAGRAGMKGVTLVETLIALSMASLLILIAVYCLRMSGMLLQKTSQRYAGQTRLLSRLRDSIAGSYRYIGERTAVSPRTRKYYDYFYGEPAALKYVSTRPLNGTGLTLTCLRYRDRTLLLEEAALYSLTRDFKEPGMPVDDLSTTIVMDDLESFAIEYLNDGRWSSAIEEKLPEGVKIRYRKSKAFETRELFVRIKDDFSDKREFMEVIAPATGGL